MGGGRDDTIRVWDAATDEADAETEGQIGSLAARPGSAADAVDEAAVEQLQRDVRQAPDLSDVVDLDDVGVAEPGDGRGLDAESGEMIGARLVPAADHLDRGRSHQASGGE